MLTKEKIISYVHAIVTTLDEVGTDAAESTFYLALGMNLSLWNSIRDLMLASGLIVVKMHRVSLTDKGTMLAKECRQITASATIA